VEREAMSAVAAQGLSVGYGAGPVLSGVEFEAHPGAGVCVLGPNGGGKTTLFRALTGELEPLSGSVAVGARPALVSQTERARLDFPVSALDVALMGALGSGRWWLPAGRGEREAARVALARVGLEERADTRFGELSGGQRQRVAIARALVADSPVLLLDEPLSGVDPASADLITKLFAELRAEGRTLLVSTHDVESSRHFDLVLCLNGRQVAFGPPADVLSRDVLERTYGSEIVVLSEDGHPLRAIAVQHHEH
jgi:manganese/iron transport system ATP-binding protein/manganese/zinc/iron transport system ATP- binding protein